MSIVYKVVDKKTRHGSNFAMFANTPRGLYENPINFIKKYKLKSYFPVYQKGKIIKAAKDSVGIFCFDSKSAAGDFMYCNGLNDCAVIIKVRSIGKAHQVKSIASSCGIFPGNVKAQPDTPPLASTVFFDSVEVLE